MVVLVDHCQRWGKLSHLLFSNHTLRWRHLEDPVGQLPSKATSAGEHIARCVFVGGSNMMRSGFPCLRVYRLYRSWVIEVTVGCPYSAANNWCPTAIRSALVALSSHSTSNGPGKFPHFSAQNKIARHIACLTTPLLSRYTGLSRQ